MTWRDTYNILLIEDHKRDICYNLFKKIYMYIFKKPKWLGHKFHSVFLWVVGLW